MKRLFFGVSALLLAAAIFNIFSATWPAYDAKTRDPRNRAIHLWAYHQFAVNPSVLVLDVWDVDGSASMMDVDRVLLDTADAMKARSFSTVILSYRGQERFLMDGEYFKKLGEERDWQNPIYTIRTMPEHLLKPDGRPAFGSWTGGVLGVMSAQMKDHQDFHRQWYVDSL